MNDVDKEKWYMQVDKFMKVFEEMIWRINLVPILSVQEISILGNGKIINIMDKVRK